MVTGRRVLSACLASAHQACRVGAAKEWFCTSATRIGLSKAGQAPLAQPPGRPGLSASHVTLRDLYKLSKGKLSAIVVATGAAGFAAGSSETIDYMRLGYTCVGTFACSAAANALNQVYEIKNDGLMRRTMLRPLPAGRMSAAQALVFAAVTGIGGGALLATQVLPPTTCPATQPPASSRVHFFCRPLACVPMPMCVQVNPLTAGLGIGNLVLYAAVYTPLKQMHPINTWVGAIVGALPPLMGWTAATGSIDPGGCFLAAVLYFWQLPHFMALAWLCKEDYARGGYRMISLTDASGRRTAAVALRNALYMVPLGLAAINVGVVAPPFFYESVGLSVLLALSASAFYSRPSQQVCPAPISQPPLCPSRSVNVWVIAFGMWIAGCTPGSL